MQMLIKKNLKYVTLLTIFCTLLSCNESVKKTEKKQSETGFIETAKWLLGDWENISDEGHITESWKRVNDSTFAGASYFTKGKDTLSSETISLEEKRGKLYYIPTVAGQNDGKPVSFKLVIYDDNNLIFENPAHNYPQKIRYTRIHNDSMIAEISGNDRGIPLKEKFAMRRQN